MSGVTSDDGGHAARKAERTTMSAGRTVRETLAEAGDLDAPRPLPDGDDGSDLSPGKSVGSGTKGSAWRAERDYSGTWAASALYFGQYCISDAIVSVPVSVGRFLPHVLRSCDTPVTEPQKPYW